VLLLDEKYGLIEKIEGSNESKLAKINDLLHSLKTYVNQGIVTELRFDDDEKLEYKLGEAAGLIDGNIITPKGIGVACAYHTLEPKLKSKRLLGPGN